MQEIQGEKHNSRTLRYRTYSLRRNTAKSIDLLKEMVVYLVVNHHLFSLYSSPPNYETTHLDRDKPLHGKTMENAEQASEAKSVSYQTTKHVKHIL